MSTRFTQTSVQQFLIVRIRPLRQLEGPKSDLVAQRLPIPRRFMVNVRRRSLPCHFRESDDTTVHGATRRGSVHALLAQVPCLVPHTEQYRESLAGMARDSTVTTQITAQNRGSRFLAGVPSRLPRTNTLPAFRLRLHLLLSPRCGSPWRPSSHPEVDIVRRFCQCGRGSAVRSSFARDRLEGMRRPGRETLLVVHAVLLRWRTR